MKLKIRCAAILLSFSASLYAIDVCESATPAVPPIQELPAACRAAKEQFRPLTQKDVDQAKKDLVESLKRLDKRLTQAGPNGEDWRKYLQWTELQAELQRAEGPDAAKLIDIYRCYLGDIKGLDLVWFLDVQQDLHNYLASLDAVNNPAVKTAYDKTLDALAERLEAYAANPTTADALAIADAVRWLENARQASDLVQAVQHYYVQPNFAVEISGGIVGAGIAGPVDDTTAVRDCILGTSISGTAHTVGQTTVELSSSDKFSIINTLFFGTTTSDTVGYHKPVNIYSNSKTTLNASKRLWIDANGLSAYPATSTAATHTQINGIQSNKDRQLVEKIAWKKAGKQKGKAEAIASLHAEQRLNKRIDDQADESLLRVNQSYQDKLRRPLDDRKLFPQDLRFSSTDKAMRIVGLQAGNSRLAAPGDMPAVVEDADMSLCIHESMINNMAADALSGKTIHEEEMQAAILEMFGRLPERMKGDEDGVPWGITFANKQPISVSFADDGFTISLHGAKYYKGDDGHPGMNVSATYKIAKTEQGFKAVRQGDIEVLPPDFVPGSGAKVDARRQIIRTLLMKRFAKVFESEMIGEGLILPGKWEAAGKLVPIQLVCQKGWLVIAWKRSPAEPKPAEAKVADAAIEQPAAD